MRQRESQVGTKEVRVTGMREADSEVVQGNAAGMNRVCCWCLLATGGETAWSGWVQVVPITAAGRQAGK